MGSRLSLSLSLSVSLFLTQAMHDMQQVKTIPLSNHSSWIDDTKLSVGTENTQNRQPVSKPFRGSIKDCVVRVWQLTFCSACSTDWKASMTEASSEQRGLKYKGYTDHCSWSWIMKVDPDGGGGSWWWIGDHSVNWLWTMITTRLLDIK